MNTWYAEIPRGWLREAMDDIAQSLDAEVHIKCASGQGAYLHVNCGRWMFWAYATPDGNWVQVRRPPKQQRLPLGGM